MTAFIHHFTYDFRTGLRDKSLLLMNYLFPLACFAMFGAIMTGINPTFKEQIIPAMIIFGAMSSALLGLPNPVLASRESGIFRSFKINGVPAINIITVPVIGAIAHIVLVSVIITALARPLFGGALPVQWGNFVLVLLVNAFCMASLGMLIGVIAPNGRGTVLIGQVFYIPSVMLSGLMMPASILPHALGRVALLLPATYAMNAFNGLAMGQAASGNPWISLLVLLAGSLLAFGLSIFLFRWDSHNADKKRSPLFALLALLPYIVMFAIG
jgi:ABC-2 type transport system permease protein